MLSILCTFHTVLNKLPRSLNVMLCIWNKCLLAGMPFSYFSLSQTLSYYAPAYPDNHFSFLFCTNAQVISRPAWYWYSHDKAVCIFMILSAEKVCRLFRYRSGLAAHRLPLHKQHTYSANHKYSHFTPIPFIVPTLLSLYCREGILRGL